MTCKQAEVAPNPIGTYEPNEEMHWLAIELVSMYETLQGAVTDETEDIRAEFGIYVRRLAELFHQTNRPYTTGVCVEGEVVRAELSASNKSKAGLIFRVIRKEGGGAHTHRVASTGRIYTIPRPPAGWQERHHAKQI